MSSNWLILAGNLSFVNSLLWSCDSLFYDFYSIIFVFKIVACKVCEEILFVNLSFIVFSLKWRRFELIVSSGIILWRIDLCFYFFLKFKKPFAWVFDFVTSYCSSYIFFIFKCVLFFKISSSVNLVRKDSSYVYLVKFSIKLSALESSCSIESFS
jgi:hypothetical protein